MIMPVKKERNNEEDEHSKDGKENKSEEKEGDDEKKDEESDQLLDSNVTFFNDSETATEKSGSLKYYIHHKISKNVKERL